MNKENYDAVIIGSGIAGMTAAIYLKRAGLKTLVIEENTPGGQLNRINTIENYPGFTNIKGSELSQKLYEQVTNLNIEYLFDKVIATDLTKEDKIVITKDKKIIAKYLLIATGRLSKKLFEDDDKLAGKGISYCALCDGNLYKDKDVLVIGAGNSAAEEALYLSNICRKVTIIIRSEFRADKVLVDEILSKKNINCVYNSSISEYNIENGKLASVILTDGTKLEASGLFVSIGSVPSAEIFDVEKDKGFIIVNNECMTNIENVYAAGDIIKKDVYQLTTAAGDGTTAAYSIIRKNKKVSSKN